MSLGNELKNEGNSDAAAAANFPAQNWNGDERPINKTGLM